MGLLHRKPYVIKDATVSVPSVWRRRVRLLLLLLLALPLVCFLFWRLALAHHAQLLLQRVRNEGHPVTLEELNEFYSDVCTNESVSGLYKKALAKLVLWIETDKELAAKLPLVGKGRLPENGSLPPEIRELVDRYVSENSEALKLLHQAATGEPCRYDADLTKGMGTPLPHLRRLRACVRLLILESIIRQEDGDEEAAAKGLLDAFSVSASLRGEPLLISQLVLIACDAHAGMATEYLVNRIRFPDEVLLKLQEATSRAERVDSFIAALAGEQCMVIGLVKRPGHRVVKPFTHGIFTVAGIADLELCTGLMFFANHIENARRCEPRMLEFVSSKPDGLPYFYLPHIEEHMPGMVNQMILKRRELLAKMATTRTALGILRYAQAHNGNLPIDDGGGLGLNQLTPEYLEYVPEDPFGDNCIRVSAAESGFAVYSLGKDQLDNGGIGSMVAAWGATTTERPPDITFRVTR